MKKRYTYNRFTGTDIIVNEACKGVVEKLNWTCASTQEANPTPDAPKPIYSSGDEGKISVWSHKKNMLNLYPKTGTSNGITYSVNSDGSVDINGTSTGFVYINLNDAIGYRFPLYNGEVYSSYLGNTQSSINLITRSLSQNYPLISTGSGVQSNTQTYTYSNDKNCWSFIQISPGKTVNNLKLYPMIVFGSSATPYEPYIGSTTDITLPVGYIGGSLPNGVEETDVQKKIGKVVLNGSENWSLNEAGTGYSRYALTINDLKTVVTANNDKCVSATHFTSSTGNETINALADKDRICAISSNRIIIKTIDGDILTLAKFKTWLSTNNVTVYYELATPVDITITKPQIPTYEGVNYITTTNNVKPSLTIEAWKR